VAESQTVRLNLPAGLWLTGLIPVFLLGTAIAKPLIILFGIICVISGLAFILKENPPQILEKIFYVATLLLITALISYPRTALFAGVAGAWCFRKTMEETGFSRKTGTAGRAVNPAEFAAGAAGAFILLLWHGSGSIQALFSAVVIAVSGQLVKPATGKTGAPPWGETAGAAILGMLYLFDPQSLVYLEGIFPAVIVAALTALPLFKLRLLQRDQALIFFMIGSLFYITAGKAGYAFLFLYVVAGGSFRRIMCPGSNISATFSKPDNFFLSLLPPLSLAVISSGVADPFPFYFAIGGCFAGLLFHEWSKIPYRNAPPWLFWFSGLTGALLIAMGGWGVGFLPPTMVGITGISGVAAALSGALGNAGMFRGDRYYLLPSLLGGTATFVISRLISL
jgi:hypothetical protein